MKNVSISATGSNLNKRRTQEERKAESQRKIIQAARELFAQQGYMRTTLNQVGAAAGYTGGLVSHRFGSKKDLLKAVVTHISSRFLTDQLKPSIETGSAEQAIRNYIEVYLKELTARENHMRALYVIMGEAIGAVPEIRDEIALLNRRARRLLEDLVKQGISTGEFNNNNDPKAASILILGMLRGITMQALIDRKSINLHHLTPLVQRQVIIGLS
ncbi:MAG: TetR/AcrR family transcriptional regulator [Planctomycetaceae bacterium]|nr:MAG: TetR/AcrR family transcriptional regulator [Planctomycetaceae bacterium]